MNHKGHNRSSSHGRKFVPRSSKPPPLHRRGQSYNHVPTQCQSGGQPSRPTLGGARKVITEVTNPDDDTAEDMFGFLQFCATCEKQIVTPGNSILYCSEACRKRDVSTPTPSIQTSVPLSASYSNHPPTEIVPQRSPTVVRPASLALSDLSISELGSPSHNNEEDRTSWYPYPTSQRVDQTSNQRMQMNRASAAFDDGMPSLSNTPTSSIGTAGSWSSYRPLPPRHDPSTGHYPNKSIDLVIPTFPTTEPSSPTEVLRDSSLKSCASTRTSFRVAEAGDVSFSRRRPSARSGDQTSSSLMQLFSPDSGHESAAGS